MKIILARHAQTAWNRDNRIQGQSDSDVTLAGMRQTQALVAALAEADFLIDAVYTSTLLRAERTGRAIARHFDCPLMLDADLNEQAFGQYEGLTFTQLNIQHPNAVESLFRRDANFLPPGGETLADAASRVMHAIRRLQKAHPHKTVCLVSHGHVCQAVLALLIEKKIENFARCAHPNGSYSLIDLDDRGDVAVRWGIATHLKRLG